MLAKGGIKEEEEEESGDLSSGSVAEVALHEVVVVDIGEVLALQQGISKTFRNGKSLMSLVEEIKSFAVPQKLVTTGDSTKLRTTAHGAMQSVGTQVRLASLAYRLPPSLQVSRLPPSLH